MFSSLTISQIFLSVIIFMKTKPFLCSTISQDFHTKNSDNLESKYLSKYYGDVELMDSNINTHNRKRNSPFQIGDTSSNYMSSHKNLQTNDDGWYVYVDTPVTKKPIEDQQQEEQHEHQGKQNHKSLIDRNTSAIERHLHKCRIWVPNEALNKYPWVSIIQSDKSKQSQLIEICCNGFAPMRWRGNTICRPQCSHCANGLCIEPGKCQCYEEFVRNESGDCVFSCPLGCLNGRCYLDGSCQCNAGYKLDATRKYCRPICSSGCGSNPLHNCTEPEVCGCNKGYILTDNDCQPICQPDCGIGGLCNAPNVCECYAGYILKNGVCQADCYQKCDNGICYSRNRCICNPGYIYHERSTQCIPA